MDTNYIPIGRKYRRAWEPVLKQTPKQHIGHWHHLCSIVERGDTSLEKVKFLVKDPKFICKICGRAAAKEENLCDPVPL